MSLNIQSLSLKINVVHSFWGGTFGAGPHKISKFFIFFSFWGSKVDEQN